MGKIGKTRLERFLAFQRAPATRTTYRGGLKKFFAVIYPKLSLEEAAEQYFDEGRDGEAHERDVQGFITSINETLAPGSVRTHVAAVRAFLEDNRILLPSAFWRRMSKKMEGEKVTQDRIPTDEELVRILEHLPLRGRALFHLLATSGIRIGSALRLRKDKDVLLNADHVQITVRAPREKKRKSFIAFASEQTKELLEEWYRVRDNYLASAVNRSRAYEKDADDDRVFPMHQRTATRLWRKALEDTGLVERDPNTNWYLLHPHMLRARVRTRMIDAGIPSEYAHALIGQRSYLDTYVKTNIPKLLEQYKRVEPLLIPSGVPRTVKELDAKMEKENKDLQVQVDVLTHEYTRLTTENEDLKKNINAILALYGGEKMTPEERYDKEMKLVEEEEKSSR